MTTLPSFPYHPDPLSSGSIIPSTDSCNICGETRGYLYSGPIYSEGQTDPQICPWCLASGAAATQLDATFFDSEALDASIPETVAREITTRTPGFDTWQSGHWPSCCNDATAFLTATGIHEIRRGNYHWEGLLMSHVVQNLNISGGAAVRLVQSLHLTNGPTAYGFECRHCLKLHFHIDSH